MREYSHVFRVERFYSGKDYRIVVYDGNIISAYERIALFIIGNGKDTLASLIESKQKEFSQNGRPEVIDMGDIRIMKKLTSYGYTLMSIPQFGEKITLLDNANLSTGGESKDITHELHTDFADIAIRATKSLSLELSGVDIITGDATKSL
jgi:D-alanine-D-alanine ligase-like ATP-grasp enzyme